MLKPGHYYYYVEENNLVEIVRCLAGSDRGYVFQFPYGRSTYFRLVPADRLQEKICGEAEIPLLVRLWRSVLW